jgi:hypothetical protein
MYNANKEKPVMENKIQNYRCTLCNKTMEAPEDEKAPSCCGKVMVMEPLPQCTNADHPEMVRNTNPDMPCNDNRGKV